MPYVDDLARREQKRRYNRLNREKVNAAERERRARNPAAFRDTKLRFRYGIDYAVESLTHPEADHAYVGFKSQERSVQQQL
jgi:hypothetical protein